ncbi:LPXTG cell wall anchor domain-containing protein, partial [Acinetobacter baumannii]|uniref:LPXTG cell wall anchor domain-containing protein n=1 Tax=Acinetobacter baumannii TaxID=470 RepID=UPI001AECD7B6
LEAKEVINLGKDATKEVTKEDIDIAFNKLDKTMKFLVPVKNEVTKGKGTDGLPKTGEKESNIAYLGLIIVSSSAVYIYTKKRKEKAA